LEYRASKKNWSVAELQRDPTEQNFRAAAVIK